VPTTIELGYDNSDYVFWNGILVPAKTPRPIVDRLHGAVEKVLALSDVQSKLRAQGVEPMPMAPKDIDAMIAKEIGQNTKLAQAAGLKFN
jgi:tripartite-type tricarboxylate transporter receptor subunit TctC